MTALEKDMNPQDDKPTDPASTPDLSELLGSNAEMFRCLVESVSDYAIFMLNTQGVIASWNTGAQRIKGYTAAEAIGRHFSVFYTPQALEIDWPAEELRRAIALGHFEDEGWRVRKDGSRFWANVIITPLRDASGELRGFSKVTRDLTERRQHEEQLREREENLRLLVEGVKDHAMFLLDRAGRIQTWNAGAQRMLGFEAAQAIGQDAGLLYSADDREAGRPRAELASARQAGFFQVEGWRRKADGTCFWADIATTVLQHAEPGTNHGFVQIIHDLSERRRMEALETEGRRISEFIAMLSHELRNPLAPIRNAVALLEKVTLQPEAAWCAQMIGHQVSHMTRLVEDLMDVSRITSGKIQIDRKRLEVNELVRLAVEAVRESAREHGLLLELVPAPQPVELHGDGTRLTQVVVNLLTNAVKYTPRNGRIRVSVESDSDFVDLKVSDNGIGMPEPLRQRAFEPFVQGTRALDRAEGGLGIGLTLVKRIVELHGGTVTAASAGAHQGTTITVTLPLRNGAEADGHGLPGAVAAPSPVSPASPEDGNKVLVVDDNHDSAETLAALLGLAGYEVQIAYEGVSALAWAATHRPRVVLLDLGLPGMDGFQVARQLRQLPGLAQTRLIAITGYGQESDRRATAEAGFELHLTKPVDPDELARFIG